MRSSVLLLAALVAGCLGDAVTAESSPAAAAPAEFVLAGSGCEEVAVIASVPAENARRFVPPEFAITGEETGSAGVLFGAIRCAAGTLDGEPLPPHFTGEISVGIESPAGPDEVATYVIWWTTDNADIANALSGLGWLAAPANASEFEVASSLALRGVSASVSGIDVSYQAELDVADAPGVLPSHVSGWWSKTASGFGHAAFDVAQGTLATGSGRVSVEAGSPLAELLGAEVATGLALHVAFDYEGPVGSTSSVPQG